MEDHGRGFKVVGDTIGRGPDTNAARVPVRTAQATLTVQHVFRCSAPGHEAKEGIQSTPYPGWDPSHTPLHPSLPQGWVVVAGSVFCEQHKFVFVDEDGQTYRLIPQSSHYGGGYLQPVGVFPAMAGWFQRATEFLKEQFNKGSK